MISIFWFVHSVTKKDQNNVLIIKMDEYSVGTRKHMVMPKN